MFLFISHETDHAFFKIFILFLLWCSPGQPISVLDGVPIAIKDEIDCSPYPTTGNLMFHGFPPSFFSQRSLLVEISWLFIPSLALLPIFVLFLIGGTKWLPKLRPCTADACCVARLRQCGAVLVGKTNMHELGAGTSGINPHYGWGRCLFLC